MIIDRIGTDKSYEMVGPYGLKIWDKKSISGTISPGEDIQQAYKELDNILEAAHSETLTQLESYRGSSVRTVEQGPEDKIQSWKTVISMCTSITALERFKPAVDREKNEELTTVYNNKFKSLQDNG